VGESETEVLRTVSLSLQTGKRREDGSEKIVEKKTKKSVSAPGSNNWASYKLTTPEKTIGVTEAAEFKNVGDLGRKKLVFREQENLARATLKRRTDERK